MRRRVLVPFAMTVWLLCSSLAIPAQDAKTSSGDGWVQLFNGKDLTGWKLPEKVEGFSEYTAKLTPRSTKVGPMCFKDSMSSTE